MAFDYIETPRLILKALPGTEDNSFLVSDFLNVNKEFFAPFETTKTPFFYSAMYQKNVLENEYIAGVEKKYLRYYAFLKEDPKTIIGTVSFGNLTPMPYNCATIGYRFHKDYLCKGYCTEACAYAINVAFSHLMIHRINAYIMPSNAPSIKVAKKLSFNFEGTCIENIKIQDKWESHNLYSLINPYD